MPSGQSDVTAQVVLDTGAARLRGSQGRSTHLRLACSRRAMWLCMPATIAVESVTSPPGATLMGGHQQSAYGLAQALLIAYHRDRECGAGHHSPLATAQAQGATRLAKPAADPRSTRRSEGGPPRLNDWEQPPRRSVPSAPRSSHEQELRATIIALVSIPSSWLMAGKKRDRPRSHRPPCGAASSSTARRW